ECFHITAFAWSIGMIAVVDHKLLGFGIQHSKPSAILRDTAPWTLLGLVVVLLSGSILFLTDVGMYLHNPSFIFKMYALAAAILFNYTIHRKVAQWDSASQSVRIVTAVVSLALWISVVFGGTFVASFAARSSAKVDLVGIYTAVNVGHSSNASRQLLILKLFRWP